jgi:hypothetical protein
MYILSHVSSSGQRPHSSIIHSEWASYHYGW